MEYTITTAFDIGERVWMPDGNGGQIKGRVLGITLFMADLSQPPGKTAWAGLNYRCIDIDGGLHLFHEDFLKKREK